MSTEHDPRERALARLAQMHSQSQERFALELSEMRATMVAMAAYCDQSITKLQEARGVPFETVSELVTELAAAADAERLRATALGNELEAARRELDEIRATCRAEIAAAHEAAQRYREDTAASCVRELNAARELALSAMDAETKVREELAAIQSRNQEIVDAQMLRLVELKRELEATSAQTDRARTAAEAHREAVAKLSQKAAPVEIDLEPVPSRHHLAPLFSAIDAALNDSPPVAAWDERLGA